MQRLACALLLALICASLGAQTSPFSAQQEYERQLDRYQSQIRRQAQKKLVLIHENLPRPARDRIDPAQVDIEVSSGADPICFSDGRFVIAASQPLPGGAARILLCEPDIAHLTDAVLGWQLAFAAESDAVARLSIGPADIATNRLMPADIDARMKARARRMVDYLVASNAQQKFRLVNSGQDIRTTCKAWQAAYRAEHSTGPIRCDRREFSVAQDEAAAEAAVLHKVAAARVLLAALNPTAAAQEPPKIVGDKALAVMSRDRDFVLDLVIQYAIAHEVGHLISPDPMARSRDAERQADAIGLQTMGKILEDSNVLTFAPLALEVIWQLAGDPLHYNRADSLHTAVYCGSNEALTSRVLRPELAQTISQLSKQAYCRK